MQTSFTDKQLLDKDNKTSETIIRKCATVACAMLHAQHMELTVKNWRVKRQNISD